MRILYVGDSPTVTTGFGVVGKNLLKGLHARGHEIYALGINHYGDPYDQKEFPFMIYPCDRGNMDLIYGYAKMWHLAKKIRPDLIFFLNDPWVIEKYFDYKPADYDDSYTKYIAYYPIDSGPLKPSWAKMLTDRFDAQVCYSHFAEGIVTEANGNKRPKNLHQIYHGVDTNTFFPVVQHEARRRLRLPQDAFIVGMVARNQYRKRFDILVQGFAKFAQDKPNAKLYLHTSLQDVGFDILDLASQYNLDNKLILTEGMSLPDGVPDYMLNLIYNSFDVHALISLGDGFGLPVAESMAVGCPQVVSDHSCLRELVEGHGGLTVKNAAWLMNVSGINTWGGLSDVDDLAEKLDRLYKNQDLRMRMAQEAYDFILQDKFNWEKIVDQFDSVINNVFKIVAVKGGDLVGAAS